MAEEAASLELGSLGKILPRENQMVVEATQRGEMVNMFETTELYTLKC